MLNKVIPLPFKKKEKSLLKEPKRVGEPSPPPSATIVVLAWMVHFYTALGLVLAAGIATLLVQGTPGAFRWSFVLMALATFVDATDGTLARKVRVKEVCPGFDGRRLDDITDFLTYTFLPLLLIWRAELLPESASWCLLLPLLASAYGFCQTEVKTDDGYFLGFPSLWNVVAFYLYILQVPPWIGLASVVVLALMTFVPSRYLYPSQPGRLNLLSNLLAAVWAGMLVWILWKLPNHDLIRASGLDGTFLAVALASLFYPAFYLITSWVISVKLWINSLGR